MTTAVEVHRDVGVFADLAGWWDAQPGPDGSPFLRASWFALLATTVLRPGDRLHVVVVRRGGEPVAALPLFRRGHRLRSLTDFASEAFDLVGDPAEAATLLGAVDRHPYLRLEVVPADSPLVAGEAPNWVVDHRVASAFVRVSADPDAVVPGLGRRLRSNLRRGGRALAALGAVEVEIGPEPGRAGVLVDECLRLEHAGWKGREGTSVLSSPDRTRFVRVLTEVAAREGWLCPGVLRLDGRVVAANLDLRCGEVMAGLYTAYDETLPPACSPSQVLLARTLEWASGRGVRRYGLGGTGGRNAWKRQWADHTEPRVYAVGFGRGPTGRALRIAWQLRRRWSGAADI